MENLGYGMFIRKSALNGAWTNIPGYFKDTLNLNWAALCVADGMIPRGTRLGAEWETLKFLKYRSSSFRGLFWVRLEGSDPNEWKVIGKRLPGILKQRTLDGFIIVLDQSFFEIRSANAVTTYLNGISSILPLSKIYFAITQIPENTSIRIEEIMNVIRSSGCGVFANVDTSLLKSGESINNRYTKTYSFLGKYISFDKVFPMSRCSIYTYDGYSERKLTNRAAFQSFLTRLSNSEVPGCAFWLYDPETPKGTPAEYVAEGIDAYEGFRKMLKQNPKYKFPSNVDEPKPEPEPEPPAVVVPEITEEELNQIMDAVTNLSASLLYLKEAVNKALVDTSELKSRIEKAGQ